MASTNKTGNIGLNLWEAGDKPAMEDFNNDNKRLDTVLDDIKDRLSKQDLREEVAKLLKKPEEQNLELAEGLVPHTKCTYYKTPRGEVVLNFCCQCSTGIEADSILATLPEGFRPNRNLLHACNLLTTTDKNPINSVLVIRTDGRIEMQHGGGSGATTVYTDTIIFIAAD